MSEPNKTVLLLSLMQVLQAGVKRHFRAARFSEPTLSGSATYIEFTVTVLSKDFRITVRRLPDASG